MFKHKQCNACINTISTTCQLKHIGYYIKFIKKKISPVWGLAVDSSQLTFVPTSKSSDKN